MSRTAAIPICWTQILSPRSGRWACAPPPPHQHAHSWPVCKFTRVPQRVPYIAPYLAAMRNSSKGQCQHFYWVLPSVSFLSLHWPGQNLWYSVLGSLSICLTGLAHFPSSFTISSACFPNFSRLSPASCSGEVFTLQGAPMPTVVSYNNFREIVASSLSLWIIG